MNVLLCAVALKVLTIGNSFSVQMVSSLPPIAADMGFGLDICSLYIGGCTLDDHWKNANDPEDKSYSVTRCAFGKNALSFKGNLAEVLKGDEWDVVTLQQGSHLSWKPESFHPYADDLVKMIRELVPHAKIVVHETWSYTPWDVRLKRWKIDQDEMYARLHAAYGDFAKQYGLEVVPTGTAVQLWRRELPVRYAENSLGGDCVGRLKFARDVQTDKWVADGDAFHMNEVGNHLQALVWAAKLFGADVTRCRYEPKGIDKGKLPLLRRIAMKAIGRL